MSTILSQTDLSLIVLALRRTANALFVPARNLILAATDPALRHEKTFVLCEQAERQLTADLSRFLPLIDTVETVYNGTLYCPYGIAGTQKPDAQASARLVAHLDVMDGVAGFGEKDAAYAMSVGISLNDAPMGVCAYLPTTQTVLMALPQCRTWVGKMTPQKQIVDCEPYRARLGQRIVPLVGAYWGDGGEPSDDYHEHVQKFWGNDVDGIGRVAPVSCLTSGVLAFIRHKSQVRVLAVGGHVPTVRLQNLAFLALRDTALLQALPKSKSLDGIAVCMGRDAVEIDCVKKHFGRLHAPKGLEGGPAS